MIRQSVGPSQIRQDRDGSGSPIDQPHRVTVEIGQHLGHQVDRRAFDAAGQAWHHAVIRTASRRRGASTAARCPNGSNSAVCKGDEQPGRAKRDSTPQASMIGNDACAAQRAPTRGGMSCPIAEIVA